MAEYVFTCGERQKDCPTCRDRVLAFITGDIKEAEEHSRENNARIWIAKKKDLESGSEGYAHNLTTGGQSIQKI